VENSHVKFSNRFLCTKQCRWTTGKNIKYFFGFKNSFSAMLCLTWPSGSV